MARRAFTLIEVMVFVAIIAILASVALPSTAEFLKKQQIARAASRIDNLNAAIVSFRTNVQKYPFELDMLTDSITSGTINTRNSCGFIYVKAEVDRWRTLAPFISTPIGTEGYNFFVGTFSNAMSRTPLTTATGNTGTLQLLAPGMDSDDIDALDLIYDGTSGSSTGQIRWSTPVNGTATMTYIFESGGLLTVTGC